MKRRSFLGFCASLLGLPIAKALPAATPTQYAIGCDMAAPGTVSYSIVQIIDLRRRKVLAECAEDIERGLWS